MIAEHDLCIWRQITNALRTFIVKGGYSLHFQLVVFPFAYKQMFPILLHSYQIRTSWCLTSNIRKYLPFRRGSLLAINARVTI